MSGGEGRGLSGQDLNSVKNLIERCLQLHMSRKEVVSVLLREANVMPSVTELLWQRLEQENQEFFEEYYIRLALKEQIQRFNELLKQQAVLMGKIQSPGVVPNGSRVAPFQQNAGCYAMNQTGPSMRPERLQPPIGPTLPGSFTNSVSLLQRSTPFNLAATPRAIGCVPDTLHVHNSNSMRFVHGLNGGIIKTENGYPSNYTTLYGAEHNLDEGHGSIEDGSIATYVGMQANSQPLNETLLGVNGSYGQLEQIPKIFSLPDLAYTNVMENYPGAFMTEPENFLNSQDRNEIQDESKVAITDSYGNYDEFGSE